MPAVCATCKVLGKDCELTDEMKAARKAELIKLYRETEAQIANASAAEANSGPRPSPCRWRSSNQRARRDAA